MDTGNKKKRNVPQMLVLFVEKKGSGNPSSYKFELAGGIG